MLTNRTPSLIAFESDKMTIERAANPGAARYNVYRGDLGDLGIPDGGYGRCASDLDGDPTDTAFNDPAETAPRSGFFYLVANADEAGFEFGLGSSSLGVARLPDEACR